MPRDFEGEARQETASHEAWREWTRQRIENIHQHVTTHDVLRQGGVELSQGSSDDEEQFRCPFHGVDHKPSARVYPEDGRSKSHAWCFVCQERWDVISLWRRFHGGEDKSFTRVLTEIEQEFSLTAPPMPSGAVSSSPKVDEALEAFDNLYEACERRLRAAKPAYQQLDDMVGYLSAGQVLDKLRHQVDKRLMTPERGKKILRQLLDRVGAKERQ